MSKMSYFGRSVMELKQKSEIVYPYSTNSVYVNSQSRFGTHSMYYSKLTSNYQFAAEAMHDAGVSAAQYFSGMYQYYLEDWRTILQ